MKNLILIFSYALLSTNPIYAKPTNIQNSKQDRLHHGGAKVGNGATKNRGLRSYKNHRMDWFAYPNEASRILKDALRKALSENNRGEIQLAREDLVAGLRKLSAPSPSFGKDQSLIMDAAQTGIQFNNAFFYECGVEEKQCQEDEDRLASIFISSYLQYMLEKIVQIDRDYYIPNYRHCRNKEFDVWQSFIVDYSKYVTGMVDLYLGDGNNPSLPWSTGNDLIELNILSILMQTVVNNLERDVFSRYMPIEINDSIVLLDEIKSFLEGPIDDYELKNFILYARTEVDFIRSNLKTLHHFNQRPTGWKAYCYQGNE